MKWYKDKLKKQTNFQRITATPEALAEFISEKIVCYKCPILEKREAKFDGECDKKLFVEWLNRES